MPMAALATDRALARSTRTHAVAQLLTLAPLGVLILAASSPQSLVLRSTVPEPGLLGVPAEVLIGVLALLWMLAGTLIVRQARGALAQSLALLIFTIPATVAAALVPALLLVLLDRA